MSLHNSFTIRPHHEGAAVAALANDELAQNIGTSGLPNIQLSFSGQENEVSKDQKPQSSNVASDEVAQRRPAIHPRTDDKAVRRVIRASPFQPMVHLRGMPRQGTISPLRVHEYENEQKAHRPPLTDIRSPSTRKKCPPVSEVCITTPSSFDCALSSPASATTFTDYKAMYFQSQKELKALQKLQERTLAENHLLRSKIKIVMKRSGKGDQPSEASRRQDSHCRSQHQFAPPPPRRNQSPSMSFFHIPGGESSSSTMRSTSNLSSHPARAPTAMQGQTSNRLPLLD